MFFAFWVCVCFLSLFVGFKRGSCRVGKWFCGGCRWFDRDCILNILRKLLELLVSIGFP